MPLTLDSFSNSIRTSELIAPASLDKYLSDFVTSSSAQSTASESAQAKEFAKYLVGKQALSTWQARKLLQGKTKGFKIGKYKLISLLGRGGMGSVFLAEHAVMERKVAIKVLPQERFRKAGYLERFHREARAVAALDHPNIVRAFDIDIETTGKVDLNYLIMEYVDGSCLHEIVAKRGPLPPKEAVKYLRQAADGLEHAHRAGLVHRDIKPANLLVNKKGQVKILDLGLALFTTDEGNSLTVEHNDKVIGTADFLAPEQAVDSHTVDHRADIYGLGCTLFFLLTGQPPFDEGTLAQRLIAHQTKQPPALSTFRNDVPASLEQLMLHLIAKDADERPETAAEASRLLSQWLTENSQAQTSSTNVGISSGITSNPPSAFGAPSSLGRDSSLVASSDELSLTATPSMISRVTSSNVFGQGSSNSITGGNAGITGGVFGAAAGLLVVVGLAIGYVMFSGDKELVAKAETEPTPIETSTPIETKTSKPILQIEKPEDTQSAKPLVIAKAESTKPTVNTSAAKKPNSTLSKSVPETTAIWGDVVTVGSNGTFKTLTEAVDFVEASADTIDPTVTRTIRLARGETIVDSVWIGAGDQRTFPPNVVIESDSADPAILQGTGGRPPLSLAFLRDFTLRNLVIDAGGVNNALKLMGGLRDVSIENVRIQNFKLAGINGVDVGGAGGRRLRFDGVTVQNDRPETVGIYLANGERRHVGEIDIENCRIIGPMATGIEIVGDATSVFVLGTIFDGLEHGVRFSADDYTVTKFQAIGNTFHNVPIAFHFDRMPLLGSEKFTITKTLFSGVDSEFYVEEGVDNDVIGLMFGEGGWVGANFSMRDRPSSIGDKEYTILKQNGFRFSDAQFASTDPSSDDYLRPQVEQLTNYPNGPEPHHVGAVPGK